MKNVELADKVCYNTKILYPVSGVMNLKLEPVFRDFGSGVRSCCVRTGKFKTGIFSVSFILPVTSERIAAENLLAGIMTNSCAEYPDFTAFGRQLAMLYGASVNGDVVTLGDRHAVRFSVSCLSDRCALAGEKISLECASLLCSMIFRPRLVNNLFANDEYETEKRELIDSVLGILNDKIKYASSRARTLMCADEPYGMPEAGGRERVEAVTNVDAAEAMRNMLSTAPVYLSLVGEDNPDEVFGIFMKYLSAIDRSGVTFGNDGVSVAGDEIRYFRDEMDVAQAKLVIGMRTGIAKGSEMSAALRVAVDMFGGGTYSLLFSNVREKMSLCYYCSARLEPSKGIIFVSSGIESKDYERARDAILAQLEDIKQGRFDDELLDFSKLSFSNMLKTVYDSPTSIDGWYFSRCFDGGTASLEEYASQIAAVTREDVMRAAEHIRPDTVYLLTERGDG